MHGKQSVTRFDPDCPLFAGVPEEAPVARYHSLATEERSLPECLKGTARTVEGEIMGVMHRDAPIYGVGVRYDSGAASYEHLAVLFVGDTDRDAGVHVAGKVDVSYRAAVDAAFVVFKISDELTGADFRRARESSCRKYGFDRVERVLVVPDFAADGRADVHDVGVTLD